MLSVVDQEIAQQLRQRYAGIVKKARTSKIELSLSKEFNLVRSRLMDSLFTSFWDAHELYRPYNPSWTLPQRSEILTLVEYQLFIHVYSIVTRTSVEDRLTPLPYQLANCAVCKATAVDRIRVVCNESICPNIADEDRCRCGIESPTLIVCFNCFLVGALQQLASRFPDHLSDSIIGCSLCHKRICLFDCCVITCTFDSSRSNSVSSNLSTPTSSQEDLYLDRRTVTSVNQIIETGRHQRKDVKWAQALAKARELVDRRTPAIVDGPIMSTLNDDQFQSATRSVREDRRDYEDFLLGSHLLLLERIEHKIFSDARRAAEEMSIRVKTDAINYLQQQQLQQQFEVGSTSPAIRSAFDGVSLLEIEQNSTLRPILDVESKKRGDKSLQEIYSEVLVKTINKRKRNFKCKVCGKEDDHYWKKCPSGIKKIKTETTT